jgi:hypothetical protein
MNIASGCSLGYIKAILHHEVSILGVIDRARGCGGADQAFVSGLLCC